VCHFTGNRIFYISVSLELATFHFIGFILPTCLSIEVRSKKAMWTVPQKMLYPQRAVYLDPYPQTKFLSLSTGLTSIS
jgi:hypothetical protein